MAKTRNIVTVSARFMRDNFGLTEAAITKHALPFIDGAAGREYDLAIMLQRCTAEVLAHFQRASETDGNDLKSEKLRQEIRKLKIDNDVEEGKLVDASTVQQTYTRGIKKIVSVLESIPQECKKAAPNMPTSAIAAIRDSVVRIRNLAAQTLITGDDIGEDE